MSLIELSKDYRKTVQKLRQRIAQLREQERLASGAERAQLAGRIKDLQVLARETRELAVVLERYYERSYYRDPQYTVQGM